MNREFKSRNYNRALRLHSIIAKLRNKINALPPIAPYYLALEILGRRGGRVKPLLRMLNSEELRELRGAIEKLGITRAVLPHLTS